MARRALNMFDYQNLIYWWQQGHPLEFIRRGLGIDPKTSRRYIKIAEEVGIGRDTPLSPETLQPFFEKVSQVRRERAPATPVRDELVPYRHWIGLLLGLEDPQSEEDKPPKVTMKTAWRRLRREKGITASYPAFRRYVRDVFPESRRDITVAMPETPPGQDAQVDFGYVGMMFDPRTDLCRKVWAFVMTLSHSRHMFVRFVTAQDQESWTRCHVEAFEFFDGVVECVLLDNLKSGVVKADIYDPQINKAYDECQRHYGFVADPCRSRKATDKAKVERSVPYVRDNLVRGYDLRNIERANEIALQWCVGEAGERDHGTTRLKPYQAFRENEQDHLKPLPVDRFEIARWKKAKVHRNHHLTFDTCYYSVPTRYVGEDVWVRGTAESVKIFDESGILIWTWQPATAENRWRTEPNHYPPGKREFLIQTQSHCRERSRLLGSFVEQIIREVLDNPSNARLRKAQAILRLADRFGPEKLDRACERAIAFDATDYATIKNVLIKGLENEPVTQTAEGQEREELGDLTFLRSGDSFVHQQEPCAAAGGDS